MRSGELLVRSGETDDEARRCCRVVLLAFNERLGLSVVPLLRGSFKDDGRRTLKEIAEQITACIQKAGDVAGDYRPDVQGPIDPVLWGLQASCFEDVEWEPARPQRQG